MLTVKTLVDIALTACVVIWFYKYEEYSHYVAIDPNETPEEIFIENIIIAKENGTFHFDFLLAVTAGLFWLKVILLLNLTRTFGPLIKIITSMMKDIIIFSGLWGIQMVFFACIGILMFGELPVYESFYDTMVMLFESAIGSWDFSIYDDLSIGKIYGEIYHIIYLMVNLILFLNLVIAILSNTFGVLEPKSLALYYDGVIEAIP